MPAISLHPPRSAGLTSPPSMPLLVEQIGTPGFLPALLGVCSELVGASDLSLFTWQGDAPMLQGAFSQRGDAAQRAGLRYVQERFDRLDDNLHIAAAADGAGWCLTHVTAAELRDRRYREACYDEVGLRERISVLVPQGAQWIFINAYLPRASEVSADLALGRLAPQAALLASATRRHLELSSPARVGKDPTAPAAPAAPAALAALSAREREVVDAILAGLSAKQAGRLLGLSPTSVATYRQRAFAKLGVRRQVELFRLLGGRTSG